MTMGESALTVICAIVLVFLFLFSELPFGPWYLIFITSTGAAIITPRTVRLISGKEIGLPWSLGMGVVGGLLAAFKSGVLP